MYVCITCINFLATDDMFVLAESSSNFTLMSPHNGISTPQMSICSHLCLEKGVECQQFVFDPLKSLCWLLGSNGTRFLDYNNKISFLKQNVN